MRPKHIAFTGKKNIGKTTLANWLLEQLHKPCAGFRTKPYEATPIGFLYAMEEITSGKCQPISFLGNGGICGNTETFDFFGTDVVKRAIASPAPLLLFDEIGRFERNSPHFLEALFSAFDSNKTILMVLKKEALPYIEEIKGRQDVSLLDLDFLSQEEVKELLFRWMEEGGFL